MEKKDLAYKIGTFLILTASSFYENGIRLCSHNDNEDCAKIITDKYMVCHGALQ